MSKRIRQGLAVLLTLCILFTLPVISSMAAEPAINVTPDADTSSAVVDIMIPDAANEEVSVICMTPDFEGTDVNQWAANPSMISYLDQITLDETGSGQITFQTREEAVAGKYLMIVGWSGGPTTQSFQFKEDVPDYTIVSDKDTYEVNEIMNLTITTPKDVNGIGILNENNKAIGLLKVKSYFNSDYTQKIWEVQISVGTAGDRELGLKVNQGGKWTVTDAKLNVTITKAVVEAAKIYEADFQADSIAVNETVQVKVRTNLATEKIGVKNERDKWVTITNATYEDTETERVWTVEMSFGSAGKRILNFLAADANGEWAPVNVQDSIVITK